MKEIFNRKKYTDKELDDIMFEESEDDYENCNNKKRIY